LNLSVSGEEFEPARLAGCIASCDVTVVPLPPRWLQSVIEAKVADVLAAWAPGKPTTADVGARLRPEEPEGG
jgi:hypothetical protein